MGRDSNFCYTPYMTTTNKQPTVYIVCGFIGAGKTTFSKKLEKETGAFRITKDEWMVRIFGNTPVKENFEKLDGNVTKLSVDFAFHLVERGIDVILDEGYWVKSQRDELKVRVENAGAKWVLYYVEIPLEEMRKRVAIRSNNPGKESFEISEEMFDSYVKFWEPPVEDEGYLLAK
jgi:predicted kinase